MTLDEPSFTRPWDGHRVPNQNEVPARATGAVAAPGGLANAACSPPGAQTPLVGRSANCFAPLLQPSETFSSFASRHEMKAAVIPPFLLVGPPPRPSRRVGEEWQGEVNCVCRRCNG